MINPDHIREGITRGLPSYISGISALGIGPPYAVMLSLVSVQHMQLAQPGFVSHPVDRYFVDIGAGDYRNSDLTRPLAPTYKAYP